MKKSQSNSSGKSDANYPNCAHDQHPSQNFRDYLRLSQQADALRNVAAPESAWMAISERRDAVARELARIARRCAQSAFEKLYIWRVECLESGADDFICFNDLFPLSAYFDLKAAVGAETLSLSDDAALFENLRNWRGDD